MKGLSFELDLSNGGEDTYKVRGHCRNCGWHGFVVLRCGFYAPGSKRRSHISDQPPATCKKCGCVEVTT